MKLDTRVKKLESKSSKLEAPRIVIVGVPTCTEGGRCDHIVAAKVGGEVFPRRPRETMESLEHRALAGTEKSAFVLLEFLTGHAEKANHPSSYIY